MKNSKLPRGSENPLRMKNKSVRKHLRADHNGSKRHSLNSGFIKILKFYLNHNLTMLTSDLYLSMK